MSSSGPRKNRDAARSSASFGIAVAVHVLALLFVPEVREGIVNMTPVLADLVEVEAEVPPEPAAPAPEEPTPRERAPVAPRPPDEPDQPRPDEPPPAADEAIEELAGVTLTNPNGDSSFTASAGSGAESTAPIQSGTVTGRQTTGAPGGVVGGTEGASGIVAEADLSVRARAPNLDAALDSNYPREAQQQSIEGTVTVSVEVRADGSIGRIQVLRESVRGYGFASACTRAIREAGAWTAARDQAGNAVASSPRIRCEFDIDF